MKNPAFIYRGLARQVTKWATLATGAGLGRSRVPDYIETADIELDCDLEAIAIELGKKAMKNKKGRAQVLKGLIRVRVVNRQRQP